MKLSSKVTPESWYNLVAGQVRNHQHLTNDGYADRIKSDEAISSHWESGMLLAEDLAHSSKMLCAALTLDIDEQEWNAAMPEPSINQVRRAWAELHEHRVTIHQDMKRWHDGGCVPEQKPDIHFYACQMTGIGYRLLDVFTAFLNEQNAKRATQVDSPKLMSGKRVVVVNPKYVNDSEVKLLQDDGYLVVKAYYYSDPVKFVD